MMTDASSMSRVGSFAIFGLDLVDLGLIFSEMCLGFCWCHVELIATPIAAIMAARAFVEKFAYCTFCSCGKCCGDSWFGFWVRLWRWWYRASFSFAFALGFFAFAFSFTFRFLFTFTYSFAFAFTFTFAFSFHLIIALPFSFSFTF